MELKAINDIGEMYIEAVLIVLAIPCIVYVAIDYIRDR